MKIAIEVNDRAGEGYAYRSLGFGYDSLGDYRKAIEYHERHRKIGTDSGDRAGAYGNLGNVMPYNVVIIDFSPFQGQLNELNRLEIPTCTQTCWLGTSAVNELNRELPNANLAGGQREA